MDRVFCSTKVLQRHKISTIILRGIFLIFVAQETGFEFYDSVSLFKWGGEHENDLQSPLNISRHRSQEIINILQTFLLTLKVLIIKSISAVDILENIWITHTQL